MAQNLSKQGYLTTVGVLGEFAPTERYTLERLSDYKRVVDAMEDLRDPNLDYHVAVKPTDLGLTLDEDLCRKEARRLLDAARGEKFEALYVLAVTTGMRQGELLA